MGGTLAVTGNTTVGGTLAVTGATTIQNLTVGGTFSGSVPAASLTGNLPANQITTITQNMDTDDVGEGSSNQYHTTARARAAISAGSGITYNSSTGVITNSGTSANNATITIAAGSNLTGGGTFTTNQSGNSTITLTNAAVGTTFNSVGSLAVGGPSTNANGVHLSLIHI